MKKPKELSIVVQVPEHLMKYKELSRLSDKELLEYEAYLEARLKDMDKLVSKHVQMVFSLDDACGIRAKRAWKKA